MNPPGADFTKRIPRELRNFPQWIVWCEEPRDEGKPTKRPLQCTGCGASTTNPRHRSSFDYALAAWIEQRFVCSGPGFVFTEDDPFAGIDLDNVWQSDADEGPRWAWQILERFADTYSEESPSGRGAKIWCRAKPPRCGRWIVAGGAIEIYDRARYFTVTGRSNGVTAITDHQHDIEILVSRLERLAGRGGDRKHTPAGSIGPKIAAGARHNTLVSLAGTLWRRGLDPEEIEIALTAVNQRRCVPPHSAEHLRRLVGSITRWER